MAGLSILTPIGPAHAALFARAEASVRMQTVAVEHLFMVDGEGRGPGWARNRLLERVQTAYVSFLDADDWLEPEFAERCLAAMRPGRYVYTDWYQDWERIKAPRWAWCGGTYHLITAIVPTEIARAIGGFDESLPAMEDTDFFLRLISRACCGRRVPIPLVHYAQHGGRADQLHRDETVLGRLRGEMTRRYGGKSLMCCGDPGEVDKTPMGERKEGDVLALALWGGNRQEYGRATGRRYPRTSYPKRVWIDPRDARAAPHLWQVIPESFDNDEEEEELPPSSSLSPALRGVAALEAQLLAEGRLRPPEAVNPVRSPSRTILPNKTKIKRLAGALRLPIFVHPRRRYPSYSDFWRLVDLSGFEALPVDEIDLGDSAQTYIFVTPEGIPDCREARAQTVFWQLEYLGDYTEQANRETTARQWSSDPAHARRTGAEFVLLGSHRGLNLSPGQRLPSRYDLTMLAYLTERRRIVRAQLEDYLWPPDYPGHDNEARHEQLSQTRLMLHVHQHEDAALTPLRLALAAAYRMPVLSEAVPDPGPYRQAAIWSSYGGLPQMVRLFFSGKLDGDMPTDYGALLYQLLCVERPFFKCIMEALGDGNRDPDLQPMWQAAA